MPPPATVGKRNRMSGNLSKICTFTYSKRPPVACCKYSYTFLENLRTPEPAPSVERGVLPTVALSL
jgi:hypothetical protein